MAMAGKRNQLGAGVILSYFSQGLQILVTLFYTPIMLRLLGQSEYGLYQLVYSVVSYLTLFTFGFSSAYIKFYAQIKVEDDPDSALNKVNGIFLTVFSFLGLLVLFLGIVLVIKTDVVLGKKLISDELETCRVLMAILVANCVIHFPTIVFQNFVIANEKFICLQVLNLIGIIINPCLTFPLLLIGFKSVSLALVLLVISVIKFCAFAIYSVSKLKMRFDFHNMQMGLLKDVGKFSFFIFIESVVSTINIGLDRFLLGRMVGSISVAVYAVGGQINTLYTSLSTSISSVLIPRINAMVASGSKKRELSDLFIKVGKIQFSVLLLVLLGFTIFGKRFMSIWAGEGYENAYYVALVLIWPNTINLIQNIAIEIQRAMGLQKYRSLMYLGIAIINIIISCIFIVRWKEIGAALGTAVAWIIGSGFIMNWYYSRRIGLDIKKFWLEILSMAKCGIPLMFFGVLMQHVIEKSSLCVYFIFIILFAVLYAILLYFFGMKKTERIIIKCQIIAKVKR